MTGHNTIEIILADIFKSQMAVNMVDDVRTPPTPFVRFGSGGKRIRWYAEEGSVRYDIYAGGEPDAYTTDGWDMWGWTSPVKLDLAAGRHKLVLRCESDADNMSGTVNDFMIKGFCLTLNQYN